MGLFSLLSSLFSLLSSLFSSSSSSSFSSSSSSSSSPSSSSSSSSSFPFLSFPFLSFSLSSSLLLFCRGWLPQKLTKSLGVNCFTPPHCPARNHPEGQQPVLQTAPC